MIESNAAAATANIDPNNLLGSVSNDDFATLIQQFDRPEINGSINNILGVTLGDLVTQVINNSPLPDFLKDAASEAISGAVADKKMASSPEAETATEETLGDSIEEMVQGMMEAADEMMKEESEGGTEGGVKSKAGAGGGNWLVALAKAMGDVAGEHLGKSVGLANEISAIAEGVGEERTDAQAAEMTALQAQMQAETQMFKLAQEATTTIVKSVGEALVATARKQ